MVRHAAAHPLCACLLLIAGLLLPSFGALAQFAFEVQATARQPDGKILMAGNSGTARISVGRLNPDGSVDAAFGNAGQGDYTSPISATEFRPTAMTVQPDGKIVLATVKDGLIALVRFESSGQQDLSFGYLGGMVEDPDSAGQVVTAIGIQYGGLIVTAGSYAGPETAGYRDVELVRYYPNGWRDQSFGPGPHGAYLHHLSSGDNEARAMVVLPDDSIFIAGSARQLGGGQDFLVAKFRYQGALDPLFGNSGVVTLDSFGDDTANAIAVDSQGRIVVGGRNGHTIGGQPASHFVLYRLWPWGGVDSALSSYGMMWVRDPYGNIMDGTLSSIAIVPGTDDIVLGGTGRDLYSGDDDLVVMHIPAYGYSGSVVAPRDPDAERLAGVFTDGNWIIAVGTRTSGGVAATLRARYFLSPLQYDTDFVSGADDSVPDAFGFSSRLETTPGEVVTSDPVRISGINVPSAVTIDYGEYSIGCDGNFTAGAGTITNGQTICVRHVAATTPQTTLTTTLTIGGVAGTFQSWSGAHPSDTHITGPYGGYPYFRWTYFAYNRPTSYECQVDGSAWAPCSSVLPTDGWTFPEGAHTVLARGVNAWGADNAPATWSWTHFRPDTRIDSGPSGSTTQTSATFNFGGTGSGYAIVFECSLDGAAFATCTNPISYSALANGAHQFQVRISIRDAYGIWWADPTPASRTWTVDTVAPDTTITTGPSGTVASGSATFAMESSEAGSTFECRLDAGTFAACSSPVTYTGLTQGSHAFEVRARDAAGLVDATPASRTWAVDTIAPETTITGAPSGTVGSSGASISFAANESGATFECRLDGAAFSACSSPSVLTGLSGGAHVFEVRATDAAGNIDASPAAASWTVDLSAPETIITSAPPAVGASTSATIAFSASEAGSTFECRLDGASFAACTSPVTLQGLADGLHSFDVRATDGGGNVDPSPASASWTVDTTAPDTSVTGGPSGTTASAAASFTFTSPDPSATFQCSLDAAAWVACASPAAYSGLADGTHLFEVRARDAAGNADATPASRTWAVDTTAPNTSITSGPDAVTSQTQATFAFSASEGASSFRCALDGAAPATCTSPVTYAALAGGSHAFAVYAVDAAGNPDASPATWAWSIDSTAPNTTITSGPAAVTQAASATFAFSSTESGGTFQCRLDGGPYGPCTSPVTYAALADGTHSFAVYAIDAAGNADASAATWSWTIDLIPDTSITASPATITNSTSASFTFTSTEAGTFECKLDAGPWGACTSPKAYTGLGQGSHTFQVRARDSSGNYDPSPASFTWTIDTSAPNTTITGGPSGNNNPNSATFTFTSSEAGTFECKLDTGAWGACTSPKSYSGLAVGSHTFSVRSIDGAGNVDGSPATRNWSVK